MCASVLAVAVRSSWDVQTAQPEEPLKKEILRLYSFWRAKWIAQFSEEQLYYLELVDALGRIGKSDAAVASDLITLYDTIALATESSSVPGNQFHLILKEVALEAILRSRTPVADAWNVKRLDALKEHDLSAFRFALQNTLKLQLEVGANSQTYASYAAAEIERHRDRDLWRSGLANERLYTYACAYQSYVDHMNGKRLSAVERMEAILDREDHVRLQALSWRKSILSL